MFNKRNTFVLIIIGIVLLFFISNIYISVRKKGYIKQIENIFVNCIKENDNTFIRTQDSQKINNSIQSNWEEEGNIKIEGIDFHCEEENWDEQYVCVEVDYKGILGNGKETEDCEYYKIYFEINEGKVYILKVGVSVGESGIYDLDV